LQPGAHNFFSHAVHVTHFLFEIGCSISR
jgi:hypothetical protein